MFLTIIASLVLPFLQYLLRVITSGKGGEIAQEGVMSMGQILNAGEHQAWVADKSIGLDDTGKYLNPSQVL